MRLSLDAQKAVFATETGDYPILLLTFSHPDLAEPIRLSTDPTTRSPSHTTDERVIYCTVSNGHEYLYFPMEISLPGEDEEAPPETRLSVCNVGLEMVEPMRVLADSPTLTMALVLASNPDRIEGQVGGFTFTDVDIDAMVITGKLVMDIMANEPFPHLSFTPATAPGLFKA